MKYIDVTETKQAILDINGIEPFTSRMIFYYDESGNCRKFSLTERGVNSTDALQGDFVLAGIAFEENQHYVDFSALYQALNYKEGQKELKFKHLYNKSTDFLTFIGSRRTTSFLQWLDNSGLYVHYSALNNLFYSIVDIVDSLWEYFPDSIPLFWDIKSALYDFVNSHCEEVINILYNHDYPNVVDCHKFCDDLCCCIATYNDDNEYYPGFFLEYFRQMLKNAGKNGSLSFIQENAPYVLIKEYYLFYLERCEIFSQSVHFFDEEPTVMKQLADVQLIEDGVEVNNYSFIKSDDSIYIQISDMVAGLLRNMFMYLDRLDMSQIQTIHNTLTADQINNFKIIANQLSRSNAKTPLMIKNANTPKNINDRMTKLAILGHR